MELKGSNDWPDKESDENRPEGERQQQPAGAPERKSPVFDLGIIYNRDNRERSPKPVIPIFQERSPSEPDVAQGVTPGSAETGVGNPQMLSPAEQAYRHQQLAAQQAEAGLVETENDDDEKEEGTAHEPARIEEEQPADEPEPPRPHYEPLQLPAAPEPARFESTDLPEEPRTVPAGAMPTVPPRPTPVPEAPAATFATDNEQTIQPPAATPMPPASNAFGGNRMPPPPPPTERPGFASGEPEDPTHHQKQHVAFAPAPATATQSTPNLYPSSFSQPNYRDRMVTRREFDRAQDDARRKMTAAVITSLALGWYLGHRKVKPLEQQVQTLQKENSEQRNQLYTLEAAQRQSTSRSAGYEQQVQQPTAPSFEQPRPAQLAGTEPFEQAPLTAAPIRQPEVAGMYSPNAPKPPAETVPAAAPTLMPEQSVKVVGDQGQEIVLQPGQRLERAGSYSVILDEHNHLVQNAIQYGEAYQKDAARERQPASAGGSSGATKASGGNPRFAGGGDGAASPVAAGSSGGIVGAGHPEPMLPSGQVAQGHGLPTDSAGHTPQEEAQHLLNAPKPNPVISAVTSPWLWLGVGILMIAFFAAATI